MRPAFGVLHFVKNALCQPSRCLRQLLGRFTGSLPLRHIGAPRPCSRLPARSVFNVCHWQTTPPAPTTFYKQYLYRGKLDEQTAKEMKRLAKNKLKRAIKEVAYAQGDYAKEMEHDALLKEATAKS